GPPVQERDLLPQPRAGEGGAEVEGRGAEVLRPQDRHRDRPGDRLLARRGLSPAVLRQALWPLLLPLHAWVGARGRGGCQAGVTLGTADILSGRALRPLRQRRPRRRLLHPLRAAPADDGW